MVRVTIGLAVVSAINLAASSCFGQTLEQALSLLISKNPVIAAARDDVQVADEDVSVAFSDFLPVVTITGDVGYERTNRPNAGSSENPLDIARERATVTLTENLFAGFESAGALASSKLNLDVAGEALSATTRDILLSGTRAYLEILRQTRLARLARDNEERIRVQLRLEDERVRRGAGITVDVLFAKSRLQIAKERRVSFEGTLRDARARYIQIFDRAPDTATMVEPIAPADLLPTSVEEAIDLTLGENPDVKAAHRQVEVADKQRKIAKSAYFPRIDLVGRANVENDVDGIEGTRRDFAVLVQLTWDIFSGFETRARVARASATYSGRLSRLTNTQRRAVEETRLAYNELMTARERVDLLQNAVTIANEVFEARKKLRRAGKETTINVLDSETELNNTLIDFTSASYDARNAAYRVLAAAGRLTPQTLRLRAVEP